MGAARRCIIMFSRDPLQEGIAKGMRRARPLFESARRRLDSAAASLDGVDLIVPRQRGGAFGERLIDAFRQARALGYDVIVAVPCDTPGLGQIQLAEAFERLASRDVVLGPAPDGGVYLIGIGPRVEPEILLRAIRWMTSRVLRDLRAAAPGAWLLEDWLADIDRPADLGALLDDRALGPDLAALVRWLMSAPRAPAPARAPAARRRDSLPALLLRGPPAAVVA